MNKPLSTMRNKANDLVTVVGIIHDSGIGSSYYEKLVAYLESINDWALSLDRAVAEDVPQDWGTVQAIYDELTGERDFVAHLATKFEADYEVSKKNFYLPKDSGSERFRERYQDAGSAPWIYLYKRYNERLKSMDKKLVRMNKILERENILTNRGAA